MSASKHAMTVANDVTLAELVGRAERRLIIVAPGLSLPLAEIVAERWRLLGTDAVSITLDVDPEVCRLGYGDIEAVELLSREAAALHTTLNTHAGVRIGVVIADDETLIYAPTPLHIEAGPKVDGTKPVKPNAIRVGLPPADLERDLGAGPEGLKEQTIGLDTADRAQIQEVKADLDARPPQPFDVSRRLRVFTAHLGFVELRLLGCNVSRRMIQIPSDLVGLADEKTRKLLESKFRLVDEADAGVWGEEIVRIKEFIVRRFLVLLPSFGYVVRLHEKAKFELAVRTLQKMLNRARHRKCSSLQAAIDRRLGALEAALLPAVTKQPPERWNTGLFDSDVAPFLRKELSDLAGTAEEMLEKARVEVRYKGVTYETLNAPEFIEAVQKAMPDMDVLHDECDAAPATRA